MQDELYLQPAEYRKDGFLLTSDPGKIDTDAVCALLWQTYWAQERPRAVIERSLKHSLCFSLFDGEKQIGLIRILTDYATFAYLCDVVIAEPYRGQGLGKWALGCVRSHPGLCALPRWCLLTRDAHTFYEQFGFTPLKNPQFYMEEIKP